MARATKKSSKKVAPKKRKLTASKRGPKSDENTNKKARKTAPQKTKPKNHKSPPAKPLPKRAGSQSTKARAKKPPAKPKRAHKYSPSTLRRYRAREQELLQEINALERKAIRAETLIEQLEAQRALNQRRHDAANKGVETRLANREAEIEQDREARQREEDRLREEYSEPIVDVEIKQDQSGRDRQYVHLYVDKLSRENLLTLLNGFKEDKIGQVNLVVEIPASPEYPGGFRTNVMDLQRVSYNTIRTRLGSMMLPGREYIHKITVERSELEKIEHETLQALLEGRIYTSHEQRQAKAEQRRERKKRRDRSEYLKGHRVLAFENKQYELGLEINKLRARIADLRRAIQNAQEERREVRRRLK